MRLPERKITERKSCFIEAMQTWVEIAIFDEEYLAQNVIKGLDLTDMEMDTYRTEVLKKWPGIGYKQRLELSLNPAAQKEVYDLIIQENPCLHPRNVVQIQGVSDRLTFEYEEIMRWFRTLRGEGSQPEVIDGKDL